jgi:phage terminase small subunit
MLSQVEGSQVVANSVALHRPEVSSASPISPHTHIVPAAVQPVQKEARDLGHTPDVRATLSRVNVSPWDGDDSCEEGS